MSNQDVKVQLNVNKLAEIGRRGARRAAAFVSLGQKAWSDETISSAQIETPFGFKVLPDPLPPDLAADVRAAFRVWIIGNALLEIERNLSLFFSECELVLRYLEFHGKKLTNEDIAALNALRRDEGANLRAKGERLQERFRISGFLLECLPGWVSARNCLAHNNGLVRNRDRVGDADCLKIKWRRMEVLIEGEPIPHDRIVGFRIEKDSVVQIRYGDAERAFVIGSRIELSEQEITEICATSYLGIDEYARKIRQRITDIVGADGAGE